MKKKNFEEGVDYTIHEYKRKKKRTGDKPICPICSECKNKRNCLNRKSKETMDRCSKCKNCYDAENCDKFYIYSEYRAEILRLGTNPNNGKSIRQQLTGTNKKELVKKVTAQIIKNQEEGVKERAYKPNEDSVITIAKAIEEEKYKDRVTKGAGYNRNMQTIKAIGCYNFALKPIQYVTKGEVERFLESERDKANSTIAKEYRIIKNVFEKAYCKKLINENYFMGYEAIKKPKSYKEDKDVKQNETMTSFIDHINEIIEYNKEYPNFDREINNIHNIGNLVDCMRMLLLLCPGKLKEIANQTKSFWHVDEIAKYCTLPNIIKIAVAILSILILGEVKVFSTSISLTFNLSKVNCFMSDISLDTSGLISLKICLFKVSVILFISVFTIFNL